MRALAFPGQGSEEPEMGLALARIDPRARALLELASELLALDVPRALERGAKALARTEVIQPVLVAVGLGFAHAHVEREGWPELVLGHSLGELTAAAFALDLADAEALSLAHARGLAMAEAARQSPGGMLAVRAVTDEELAPLLAEGLELAAHNAPDERVLAGSLDALARAERATTLPTRRLAVAGPWHARTMSAARTPFEEALRGVPWDRAPRARLFSAVTLEEVPPSELAETLADGLVRPVRWAPALQRLEAAGLRTLEVAPPSRILAGLCRRTLRGRDVTFRP
jgi:[acyl-carrier-protein] S-malonyltransferase